jgi:hypothetical protein
MATLSSPCTPFALVCCWLLRKLMVMLAQTAFLEATGRLLDFFTQAFTVTAVAKKASYLAKGKRVHHLYDRQLCADLFT